MPDAKPWRFTQLGPPNGTLVLDGPNAPFGRPRRGAVVEKERTLRHRAVYYPGSRIPTRHIFSDKHEPEKLSGRFMDSRIGAVGGARAKADEVDAFVADQVPVRVEWGGIHVITGLITSFKAGYESEAEIPWSMTIEVDSDDTKPTRAPVAPPDNAAALIAQVEADLAKAGALVSTPPDDIEYEPGFLDSIANFISDINQISASIASVADSVDQFVDTLYADVEAFRGGIHQLQTTVEKLQITLGTGINDAKYEAANAKSQGQWAWNIANANLLYEATLGNLSAADLAAEKKQIGATDRTIRAKGGDTWESLARTYLGSSSKADALRQANGAKYGEQPSAGSLVHIPKGA